METRTFISFIDDEKKIEDIEKSVTALEIDFSGVGLTTITAEQVQTIIRTIDRSVNITAITLSPSSHNPHNAPHFQELQKQLLAIVTRNRLIQDFDLIAKLGLTPDAPGFDPWKVVMQSVIPTFVRGLGAMPLIAYNAPKPLHRFFKYFKDMGAVGFEKCWQFILSEDYPKTFPRKFEFATDSEIGMEPVEVLECINQLQEAKDAPVVPFDEFLIFDPKRPLVHTERFRKAVLKFLQKNRHLTMLDIGTIRRHVLSEKDQDKIYKKGDAPPEDFLKFCETLEKENIATNIRLPYSHPGREELDIASQRAGQKIQAPEFKAQAQAAVELTATVDTTHFTVPDSWWLALPDTEVEPEEFVYEQEVATEAQIVAEIEQQAEQKIESQFENTMKMELDFKPNVLFVIDKNEIIKRYGKGWYEQLAGTTNYQKDWTIDYATEEACNQIEAYPECFVDGLVIDPDQPENNNLPAGFGLIKKFNEELQKNEWTLFFDGRLPEKKQQQALRVKLTKLRNKNGFIAEGSYKSLVPSDKAKALTAQEKEELKTAHHQFVTAQPATIALILHAFQTLLKGMDPTKAGQIFKKYQSVLDSFNHDNFYAMRDILQNKGGIDGIATFLENCLALKVAGLYPSFKRCFLDKTTNFIDFNTPAALQAIRYLLSIKSSYQKGWWNALANGQYESGPYISGLFFADKVNAFRAFCEELQRMGLDISKINPPHHLYPVNNINITLNRILLILQRNPQYAKDQLNHLDNINFGNDHAFYAVRQGFHFVTSEMDLCPEKSCDEKTLDYRVKFADLIDTAKQVPNLEKKKSKGTTTAAKDKKSTKKSATLQKTIAYFYRYLATSETPLSISDIRNLVKQVTNENLEDKKPFSGSNKALILPLLARAIESNACLNVDNVAYCQKLIAILQKTPLPEELIELLLNFANENCAFNLRDLVGMAQYYQKNGVITDFNWSEINKVGPSAFKAFVQSGFKPQPKQGELKKLKPDEWSKLAKFLAAKTMDGKERFYSAMAVCDVSLAEAMTLFDMLSRELADVPATLKRLLTVLNQINTEFSTQFPTITELQALVSKLRKTPTMTGPQISHFLTQKMPGINFTETSANKPFTEVDFQQELESVKTSVESAIESMRKEGKYLTEIAVASKTWKRVLGKCTGPVALLDEVDQLFNDVGTIKTYFIKKKYNPYAELKDICDKKIAADCTQTFVDQTLAATFRTEVLQALGPINLEDEKKKDQRTRYFERYELYKSLCQKLQSLAY